EDGLGARGLVSDGRSEILVDGRVLPPRYPPWFSLVLAPAYLALGMEPGNGIVPVTALGVAGIVAAYRVGTRLGSPWSGAAAALAVLALSDYLSWGRQVMTDEPGAALTLFALLVYLRLPSGCRSRPRD